MINNVYYTCMNHGHKKNNLLTINVQCINFGIIGRKKSHILIASHTYPGSLHHDS